MSQSNPTIHERLAILEERSVVDRTKLNEINQKLDDLLSLRDKGMGGVLARLRPPGRPLRRHGHYYSRLVSMKFFWQSGSADKLFSDDVVKAAVDGMKKFRIPASVSIAQYGIESGWGAHCPGNNPFGMKPRQGKNDPQQFLMTTEFIKGKYIEVQQPFRKFTSLDEAFDAHAELLATASVYHAAYLALPDTNRFIDLMAVHYATDPLYASKIKNTISAHSLSNYDK